MSLRDPGPDAQRDTSGEDHERSPAVSPASESGSPNDTRGEKVRPVPSLARIRALRRALAALIILLAAAVGWSLWTRRPVARGAATPPPPAAATDTLQRIEKFRFTSTISGRRAFSILADRLIGAVGGVHTLEGIRSVEVERPDGNVLTLSAERGRFVEGDGSARTGTEGGGQLVLEGRVRVEGTDGTHFESERVEYSQREGTLVSPGPSRFRLLPRPAPGRAPRTLAGSAERLVYRLKGGDLSLGGGVTIALSEAGAPDAVIRAASAEVSRDGRRADLRGSVSIEQGEDFLSAPQLLIEQSEDGSASTLRAEPRVRARMMGAPEPASATHAQVAFLLACERLDLSQVGSPLARTARLTGKASVQSAGAEHAAGRRITADVIDLREDSSRSPRTIHAQGRVAVALPAKAGQSEPTTLSCQSLDATADPDGALASADVAGEVRMRAAGRIAGAERAHIVGETRVELRGGRPWVQEGDRHIVADEIDILSHQGHSQPEPEGGALARAAAPLAGAASVQAEAHPDAPSGAGMRRGREAGADSHRLAPGSSGQLTGRGRVRSRFVPEEGPDSGPFRAGVPVEVSSDSALLSEGLGGAEFSGHVFARQGDRALTAKTLVLSNADRSARGEGAVSLRMFREEARASGRDSVAQAGGAQGQKGIVTPSGPVGGVKAEKDAGSPSGPARGGGPGTAAGLARIPVQVSADSFVYGPGGNARFEGHAVYREPGRMLSAGSIALTAEATGVATEIRAEGRVLVEGDGKRAQADTALYDSAQHTITLGGREVLAEVLETATGRTWRGPSLTWVLAADSIPVVTGELGRSKIVGSASLPGRERVGRHTEGRRPR